MSVPTTKLLERILDYASLKQKVISENIANVQTVNYKRKDVEFVKDLNKAMDLIEGLNSAITGSDNYLSDKGLKIVEDKTAGNVSGFNNVDVNREMAEMAQNTLLFKFASRKLSMYFKTLQGVIRGELK